MKMLLFGLRVDAVARQLPRDTVAKEGRVKEAEVERHDDSSVMTGTSSVSLMVLMKYVQLKL